ncbi:hypothetical protein DFP72DRAFT_1067775 [Ephemerocybe angulata]|uniref:Uncharacterized protein n=1 Tax=Ephemerocybe angulata TaxID=980116 RepID=A0A8H6I146_9AGAR|nr:hypothetical protein DFP72DRAFT_1067775 [Tulosesus angulatus]
MPAPNTRPQRAKQFDARLPKRSRIQDRPPRRKNSHPDPSSPPPKPRATTSGAVLDPRQQLEEGSRTRESLKSHLRHRTMPAPGPGLQRAKRFDARLPRRSRAEVPPMTSTKVAMGSFVTFIDVISHALTLRRTNSRPDPSYPPPKSRATTSGAVLDPRSSFKLTVSDPRVIEEPTYDAKRCQLQARARSERNDLTRSCLSGLESKTGRRGPHPQTHQLTSQPKLPAPETKSNNIGSGLGSET